MSKKLIDFTLNRAGWGDGQSLDLDVGQIETVRDPETLPNLLRVTANGPLADILSWPERSGCALQCQFALSPVGVDHSKALMTAEAVKCSGRGETFEIELVEGWRGEPHYWGNRRVHEEEVEAAIHGMASNGELQLLSFPTERDTYDRPQARILKSKDDIAVLFIASTLEEARILSGVVGRLCDTGGLVHTGDIHPPDSSSIVGAKYQRTDKKAPRVTRWLGGHGTRAQQAIEQRIGTHWHVPERWSGVSP